ncbi:MAG TPA: Hsp20/alpha crystallin family protein [Desulfohalobiaceae bacterium]|nr:Hsp20/alpha crystallin family protein [Desulfohalobiaceae bacterium]
MLLEKFNPRLRKETPSNIGNDLRLERDFFDTMRDMLRMPIDELFSGEFVPTVDVREKENEMVIRAEIPGLEPNDVDVSLQEGNLVIKGEKKIENEDQKDTYYQMESKYGSFYRTIPVSREISEKDIKASFKNGVLTVQLPKNKVDSGKKIPIDVE